MPDSIEYIRKVTKDYMTYVATMRAIPDMRDGLKSSQRIALWTMQETSPTGKMKTQGLAGAMIAKGYYVHGDAAAADTISGMAAPLRNNNPVFEGHGAFGTLDNPSEYGAPRYTSVSLSKFTKDNVLMDRNIYTMIPTVDDDGEICEVFHPMVPLALLNGSKGVAVGYSTDILPHSLKALKKAVRDKLNGLRVDDINPFFSGYDVTVKPLGDLSYMISGKVDIVNTSTVRITSIPPMLTLEKVKENLENLKERGRITSFDDETSDEISITVKMKRVDLAGLTVSKLIKLFKIETRATERLVMVDRTGKRIKQYRSHDEYLTEWVEWRLGLYVDRYKFLLKKTKKNLDLALDIEKCFAAGLSNQTSKIDSKDDLVKLITDICGRNRPEITQIPLYRWTKSERESNLGKIDALEMDRKNFENHLSDENLRKTVFLSEI